MNVGKHIQYGSVVKHFFQISVITKIAEQLN